MRVLVLGSGAREHAIAWRLARDEAVREVAIAPGNAGTPAVAETVRELDILDPVAVARHAGRERYDLVVIGPDAAVEAGVADALQQAAIPVFGPSRAAGRLEWSKSYAKQQMQRAGVPTPSSSTFTAAEAALAHARSLPEPPVVKADWLALGKGVVVPESPDEAADAIRRLFAGGPAGGTVMLEERLLGREVSVFALVSGEAVVPLGAACDYKRLGDGDSGPNTGGMGAYSPVPWFGAPEVDSVVASVFEPIAWRMARDGAPYRGVLYAGLMVTAAGPMVLEFNARFGDPEAQVLLPLLEGELARAMLATAQGDFGSMAGSVGMNGRTAVGVVLASEGYPGQPISGRPLRRAEPASRDDDGPLLCFHAATRQVGDEVQTAGGRVATFVGLGDDLGAARQMAYRGVRDAALEGGHFRGDIAAQEGEA